MPPPESRPPIFVFDAPLRGQLSETGAVGFALWVPDWADPADVEIVLDGEALPPEALVRLPNHVVGSLDILDEGGHTLAARLTGLPDALPGRPGGLLLGRLPVALTWFETVSLENADVCEPLNDVECLLPYPSTRFLEEVGAETQTGFRLQIPAIGMPDVTRPPLSPAPLNGFDGFSPTVQVLMHFPQGVDLGASDAPILLEARCCGQSPTPPLEAVRTVDDRSLQRRSPTVLLDTVTGERLLHFVELDARAEGPARQVLFLRPGESLVPGRRYVVAVRRLVDPTGAPVEPEAVFRALRDGRVTTIASVEERRERFEDIFDRLRGAGVRRSDLTLAFDFVVRSDEQLTADLRSMRDQALTFFDTTLLDVTFDEAFNAANFHPDCRETGEPLWRRIKGSYGVASFLTGRPDIFFQTQFLARDADGVPLQRGVFRASLDLAIPCAVLDAEAPLRPLLLGHGLFQNGSEFVDLFVELLEAAGDEGVGDFLVAATDWRGLSSKDLTFIGQRIIGGLFGSTRNHLNDFPSLVARLQQGMTNTLVLGRLLRSGRLNDLEPFQLVPGDPATGAFAEPAAEIYYDGISLGGIMGLLFGALSPDVERLHIDVGAMNFSLLLQRSTQFVAFETLLENIGLTDPMDVALGLGLLHEEWVVAEPAGFIRHVTGLVDDPLPDTNPKQILMSVAWLDKQVSNTASEIAARSLGIANLEGSLVARLQGVPDLALGGGGAESGYVVWDGGSFDVFDPAFDAVIPPLANEIPSSVCDPHPERATIPASLLQVDAFLRPGGRIFDFCADDGVCNASSDAERPGGRPASELCNPLE